MTADIKPVAHRWRRNGDLAQAYWVDGVPSDRTMLAQQQCAEIAIWTVEYAYSQQAIDSLRAEVAAWRELSDHVRAGACNAIWPDRYTDARTRDVSASLKRAERLEEALREMLVFYGERVDAECRTKDWRELEAISAARDALEQEVGNG